MNNNKVILKKLQQEIIKVEGLKTILDDIAMLNPEESEGQYYNGIRIDEDTILILMSYWDAYSNQTEYFHYSISKNEFVKVDEDMDEKYREVFEDCDMLDCLCCFYIIGVEPIGTNKDGLDEAEINYGNEYDDTIINLLVS